MNCERITYTLILSALFDLYRNPNPASREWAPYLVDLQHEMLSGLSTRIMAPLVVAEPSGATAIQLPWRGACAPQSKDHAA